MKLKKDVSVITVCVIKSLQICKMKQALLRLRAAKVSVSACNHVFAHEGCLQTLASDIEMKITELEWQIAKLLSPFYLMIGVTPPDRAWFSTHEIRRGYMVIGDYVLLLRPLDVIDDVWISEGNLYRLSTEMNIANKLEERDAFAETIKSIPLSILIKQWYS